MFLNILGLLTPPVLFFSIRRFVQKEKRRQHRNELARKYYRIKKEREEARFIFSNGRFIRREGF